MNKEIAALLGISVRTVETHRAKIMLKLGLHSLAELIHYAIRHGIIARVRLCWGWYSEATAPAMSAVHFGSRYCAFGGRRQAHSGRKNKSLDSILLSIRSNRISIYTVMDR